ncbi:hypothetical protein [Neisseria sp. Ec49-e6-T10]|uniref:hypothetical protein n=1 Tax=Neisseria sp. Ec49-e6-T10 TaxID=3140744 RepID=UPI003EBFDE95
MMTTPYFLITIDTEGDNLWQNDHNITTQNAQFLTRFQNLCEQYHFKVNYLTNYEMAKDHDFIQFGKDIINRGTGEIGTHLHAWNNPPIHQITDDDYTYKTYLIDYPDQQMKDKFDYLHKLLEDTFSTPMKTHRAGRWALDKRYLHLLSEYNYWVDCSVTPCVNWSSTMGAPLGLGGTDYSTFPQQAYFMDLDTMQSGESSLLQVPMSIRYKYTPTIQNLKNILHKLQGKHKPNSTLWLRPKKNNLKQMMQLSQDVLNSGSDYLEFMLHSSEFMPSGSPTFRTHEDIEKLYQDLAQLFKFLSNKVTGATLSEYYLYQCALHNKTPT